MIDFSCSSKIDEKDFAHSFLRGSIKIYIDNKSDYSYFCNILSNSILFAKITYHENIEKLKDTYEEVYEKNIGNQGIVTFILNPAVFDDDNVPSGAYDMMSFADNNPEQKKHLTNDLLYFREIKQRLVGEITSRFQLALLPYSHFFKRLGDEDMSRKIGNFYDEKTGETHWLEPATVKDYPLPPGRIAELGQSGYRTVNYALFSNEDKKTIELVANVELSSGEVVHSDPASMDELTFAELLFDAYSNDHTFANKEEIKAFTEQTSSSLAAYAYETAGIILDGLSVDGFGSIFYGKDRVGTFDGLKVKIEAYGRNPEVELANSVSQTAISLEKNPSITFIAKGKELSINSFNIKEIASGIVSQYTIETETIAVTRTGESMSFEHAYDDSVTPESPYMAERTALLASAELEDDSFEDRFDFL